MEITSFTHVCIRPVDEKGTHVSGWSWTVSLSKCSCASSNKSLLLLCVFCFSLCRCTRCRTPKETGNKEGRALAEQVLLVRMNNYESNYIFTICDVILTISCTYLGIIAELLAVSKNRSICLAVNAQNDMELNSRLESLKVSDLEAFLDASLAALRLIQNILQHPLNERYRRLRGTAPVSRIYV